MITLLKRITIVLAALMLCSCATVRLPNKGNIKSPIDMKAYQINLLDEKEWGDWEATTDQENEILVLKRLSVWPLTGELLGTTTILVVAYSVPREKWHLAEEEVANYIRDMEIRTMMKEDVEKGKYELEDIEKDVRNVEGKKLYRMSYTAKRGSSAGSYLLQKPLVEAAFYVYFPSNFTITHKCYKFLITEAYKPGRPVTVDVDRILPIISGFQLKPQ